MAFDTSGSATNDEDGLILVQGTGSGASTKQAGYQGNTLVNNSANNHFPVQSNSKLALSPNGRGDALIFPMFKQDEGWGTEIVVRNTDPLNAIVAKVAIFEAGCSREVFDFNIYLSAADVVRFKIEDGHLWSEDGSIIASANTPDSKIDIGTFASSTNRFDSKNTGDQLNGVNKGYVVVYGMGQAKTSDPAVSSGRQYHKDHLKLFANYRKELDACRPGWRVGSYMAMEEGTFLRNMIGSTNNYSIATPNQAENCTFTTAEAAEAVGIAVRAQAATIAAAGVASVADVAAQSAVVDATSDNADALGALAITQAALLNATSAGLVAAKDANDVAKVTADNAAADLADAESEQRRTSDILALADAQVISTTAMLKAVYARNTAAVPGNFFGDVGASLTGTVRLYNGGDAAGSRDMMLPAKAIANFTEQNKILWAEGEIASLKDRRIQGDTGGVAPTNLEWARYNEKGIREDAKAFLVSNTSYSFAKASIDNQLVITQPYKRSLMQLGNDDGYWKEGSQCGSFSISFTVFNEDEETDTSTYFGVSPHTTEPKAPELYGNELQLISYLEETTKFEGENGFALVKFFGQRESSGIPAIVSQMIGTIVKEDPQVNWIYSQTN